jgi:hypothetical protein
VPRAPQSPFLLTWEDTAPSGLPSLFQREEERGSEPSHIPELEPLVGGQRVELELANTSLQAAPWDLGHLKVLRGQVGRITGFAQPEPIFPSWAPPQTSTPTPADQNTPSEQRLQ